MTVQYDGNGYYTVYQGNRTTILSQAEINEIQSFNFPMMRQIEKSEEDFEDEIGELREEFEDFIEELDKILSSDEINSIEMWKQISAEITKYRVK